MRDSSWSSKHQNADRNMKSKAQARDFSIGLLAVWTRGHVYYILAEILSSLCLYPETLWKTKVKDNELINLKEEISKQPNIQNIA